jgi:hypothetical protein
MCESEHWSEQTSRDRVCLDAVAKFRTDPRVGITRRDSSVATVEILRVVVAPVIVAR